MRTSDLSGKKELRIVGIMNGTSVDGMDFVLCKVLSRFSKKNSAQTSISYLGHAFAPFSPEMKKRLLLAAQHQLKVDEIAKLHHDLGRVYSKELQKIATKKKWKFDAIGLHGQTVFHAPPEATLQIGEPSYLSKQFQVPVVSDFRTADLAVGGQGAPIASLFHRVAFQEQFPSQVVSLHNLGGISNLTWIDSKGHVKKAFDTGPANILMDQYIQKVSRGDLSFDVDGHFAAKGLPLEKVVEQFLQQTKYFHKKPPKSCGREEFGKEYLKKVLDQLGPLLPEDKMATLAELTARSISEAYKDFCPETPAKVILCGGGSKNKYLKSRIQYHLPKTEVITTDEAGWPASSIEGAAFALLAAYRIWEIPSNLPETTGAKKSVTMGKVVEAF